MDFRYNDVLSSRERMIFELRLIYAERGYVPYKMSKFEEYDLYGKNRDFLLSDKVITFTDTNGKLMALKPDVTLSIIKNTNNANGSAGEDYIETSVQKLYYNESVYRVAKSTDSFKEIMQVGAECIGDVGIEEITEMLEMAVLSMGVCKSDAVLDVSNLDILSKILSEATESGKVLDKILKCIEDKNIHGIKDIFRAGEISDESAKAIIELIGLYGKADEILDYLPTYAKKYGVEEEAEDFRRIINALPDEVRAKIIIDFSEVGDMSYYNGIIFKGFVEGIPGEVLSGGQYDKLLRKMKRKASGIGFAINMDVLERVDTFDSDVEEIEKIIAERDAERRMLNVALPKGRLGEKVYAMFEAAGYECPSIKEDNRKLIFENEEAGIRYFWGKPSDVAIYVERGAADIGVAGKDILVEYEPDVYELADLEVGKCRMCVAGPLDYEDDPDRTLRVATKFVKTAIDYYSSRGRDIDIIKLNGSIELAPILGLSDVIVDIVETGTTLKENKLEIKREIYPISARLIANKSGFKFKNEAIEKLLVKIAELKETE